MAQVSNICQSPLGLTKATSPNKGSWSTLVVELGFEEVARLRNTNWISTNVVLGFVETTKLILALVER